MAKKKRPASAPEASPLAATCAALLLGGVLPLLSSPTATDPFMPLRLLVLGLGLAVGMLAVSRDRLSRRIVVVLGLGAAAFTIAAVTGRTPVLSLIGRYPRYEGLPMVAAYALALAVGARMLSSSLPRRTFTAALAGAAGLNGVVAAGQALFGGGDRVTGLLGNATTLGTFGLVAAIVVGWSLRTSPRALSWVGLIGAAACVALSASRGVLVGVAVSVAVMLLLRRRDATSPRWQAIAGAGAVLLVGSLLIPQTAARITGASPFAESTISGRLLLWGESVRLWLAHPVTGTGPSRFVDEINPFNTPQWAAAVGPYAPPDSPHNVALQVLCGTGLLGLAALVAIAVTAARDALSARTPQLIPATAMAAGLVATYLTSFTDPVTTTLGALVIGGAIATRHDGPVPTWVRATSSASVAAVALWLGITLVVAEAQYSRVLTSSAPEASAVSAMSARPWDPDVTRRVAYTVTKLAETSQADITYVLEPLEAACNSLPGSVECQLTLSSARDVTGDHARALAAADAALTFAPTNVDAHLARGIALAELSRYNDSEASFLEASRLRPTASEPWSDLAHLYTLMGRTADSQAAKAKADALAKR